MSVPFYRNTAVRTAFEGLHHEFLEEFHNILDWWTTHMVDEVNGGFYGRMDGGGVLHPEADKGAILNTRILWTFAAAARETGLAHHRVLADRAYAYINTFFWDEIEGGVFWSLDYKGNPSDTQKQIYAQAFAIYAFAEYYALTKNREALDRAIELFWLVEKYSRDRSKEGYLSAFTRDWSNKEDVRLSEKDINEVKIMNTHLHLLEAYTNFYRVRPFAALGDALKNCIQLFIDHFFIPENGSMHIYFDEAWNPKGNDISFGHNIEASWLLWEAVEVLGNTDLQKRVGQVCIRMAEAVLDSAVDADGGVFYEAEPSGIKDFDKHWWPQAEAVVGFWNAFEMTGELEFEEASRRCWTFIKGKLLDPENGEWHWRTDRKGVPYLSEDKAGPWKAPYHNGRMCLEMLHRVH